MTILNYSEASIGLLSDALKNGKNICIPTDTIYGIIASSNSVSAIQNIFTLKNRDNTKPLALLVNSIDMAKQYFKTNEIIEKLMTKFWPGALTIISEKTEFALSNPQISFATFNNDTIGIRFTNNELINKIITSLNTPIFATSINESGKPALNNAVAIENFLITKHNPELYVLSHENYRMTDYASTVLKLNKENVEMLRKGALTVKINNFLKLNNYLF